jgi:hypothetical protein
MLRKPARTALIERIYTRLDANSCRDLAWFSCLTTVFNGTARLGEFVIPSIHPFDASKHISPSGVSEATDHLGNQVTQFRLPWTKVSRTGETVFWAKQDGVADPDTAPSGTWRRMHRLPMAHSLPTVSVGNTSQ